MPTQTEVLAKMNDAGDRMLALVEKFDSEADNIDAAVAAAVAAAPDLHRVYYVDANSGDDATGLGTQGSPFKTIKKAFDTIPQGGTGRIEISLSQTHIISEDIDYSAKRVHIGAVSYPQTSGERPVIQFNLYEAGEYNNIYCFRGSSYPGFVSFTNSHLEVNDSGFNTNNVNSTAFTLIQCSGYATGSDFYLSSCAVSLGENGCPLLNSNNACSSLALFGSDFDATSGSVVETGSSGIVTIAVNTCTKDTGANWYNNPTQVLSNV